MKEILTAEKMENVHSDIRGPLFYEANDMTARGIEVLKLNTGNPASFGFEMPNVIRRAIESGLNRTVGYCDFRGMPDAREAILGYHKKKGIEGISVDDIYVGNGVSEIVSLALTALLNTGDEVLVPSPCYSLWSNSVRLSGGKPVFYLCDEASDWYPDTKDIESKITGRTRAIVIINPNNPTGALYPCDVLMKIADIARRHGLLLFSDEIYDRLVMDGKKHTSLAALAPDIPVVTMNGLSKSHCLCGFRCGWMIVSGPRAATLKYQECLVKLTSLRLCANTFSQIVIPAALEDSETPAAMVRPGGRIYEQREAAARELEKIDSLSFVKNSAAFYVFPRLDIKRLGISDDKRFARDLLHATNVLIVPGSGFEWQMPDHFRIVLLPEADILADAVRRIGVFLDAYRQN